MASSEMNPRMRFGPLILHAAAAVLIASGFLHLWVWLAEGGSLEGPVSWRKPILFGLSASVTLSSVAWVLGVMRPRRGEAAFALILAGAMVVEVGLITLQQWRGVPSHFNRSTELDASILNGIETLIVVVTIAIAYLTLLCFGALRTTPDVALAIRCGMVLLLFSCLLGFVLVAWGNFQIARGQSPETFGAAGVMKFPHGAAMHAIQMLPIFAWFLWKVGVEPSQRFLAIQCACGAVIVFTIFSLGQTFTGRGRFDLSIVSALLLLTSVALMTVPAWIVIRRGWALVPGRATHLTLPGESHPPEVTGRKSGTEKGQGHRIDI